MSGNTHEQKSMNHSDKQILLLGIRKEFNISLTTAVTDHGKAGNLIFIAFVIFNRYKSPVHLVGFSRLRLVTCATAALRGN